MESVKISRYIRSMAKKISVLCVAACLIFISGSYAMDITTLLKATKKQPSIKASELLVTQRSYEVKQAYASLFPSFNAFGSLESYNSPTNLRPLPPTEVNITAGESIPFSDDILRYGVTLKMPVFVKSLYTLASKMKLLREQAEYKKQIDTIEKEASLISLNSTLQYLNGLEKAIDARLKSLSETKERVEIEVSSGRAPEAKLLKIEKLVNELERQRNEIDTQTLDVKKGIRTLTNIRLASAVPMEMVGSIEPGEFIKIHMLQKQVGALKKESQRTRELLWPSLYFEGVLSDNRGEAYNTHRYIKRTYNYLRLVLEVPLFQKSIYEKAHIARTKLARAQMELAQERINLASLADDLHERLPIIYRSIELARTDVKNTTRLLGIAKVAFKNGRMTTEEYLRYEADVLKAESNLYRFESERWQVIAQQALLYGRDLIGVIR